MQMLDGDSLERAVEPDFHVLGQRCQLGPATGVEKSFVYT
jgi:hypothetical protein